jgi:hypothetical protein
MSERRTRPALGMGLDLDSVDQLTESEREAFRRTFEELTGRPHHGLNFWLDARSDVLKRYRSWADRIDVDRENRTYNPNGFGFLVWYALNGYEPGVRYLLHVEQRLGLTREEVLEGIALAFIWAGPRGMETIARGLDGYEWQTPAERPRFPDGWAPDPEAFASGLDFTSPGLSDAELRSLTGWYERVEMEVPAYVPFLTRERPELLKAYRNRFENTIRLLPRQVMPYVMIHVNTQRGFAEGIREGILLARGFGMTRAQTLEAISWGSFYGGVESLSIADRAAGDLLSGWK